jgi:hypothetical protein
MRWKDAKNPTPGIQVAYRLIGLMTEMTSGRDCQPHCAPTAKIISPNSSFVLDRQPRKPYDSALPTGIIVSVAFPVKGIIQRVQQLPDWNVPCSPPTDTHVTV